MVRPRPWQFVENERKLAKLLKIKLSAKQNKLMSNVLLLLVNVENGNFVKKGKIVIDYKYTIRS